MTLHTGFSYTKSAIRGIGFMFLAAHCLVTASLILIFAEIIGVAEEMPSAYKGTKTS